jgi:hypothetical protein
MQMPSRFFRGLYSFLATGLLLNANAAFFYVDATSANSTPPFGEWRTAARNIQDAIEQATTGDTIFVTNGVYSSGGKVLAGDLTNRVAIDKTLTIQSVNGPLVTIIEGGGATNGIQAVRGAWLTNGAALIGFTIQKGHTRRNGDLVTLCSGGGIWCASSNVVVANCILRSNTSYLYGGGAYQGYFASCLLVSNAAGTGSGLGGGAYSAVLNNCTLIGNSGGGAPGLLTNCIAYNNSGGNYLANFSSLAHCCATPLAAGEGNFTNAPQLFADGTHLTLSSPCRAAGAPAATATDLFGQSWSNPPSIGCAEWQSAPIASDPRVVLTSDPVGFSISAAITGEPDVTTTTRWMRDGTFLADGAHYGSTQTTNMTAIAIDMMDAGNYALVVSNVFGAATSGVARVVIHFVGAASPSPAAPYASWSTAATNIQDAIDVAVAGEIVLVTNGVYASGGKVMEGNLTNRVAIDKELIVQSINGPGATTIRGALEPNAFVGPSAVRCAWLTNRATISGFTLYGGATRTESNPAGVDVGGGVKASSTNATVFNCWITSNCACSGGGAYKVKISNSLITANSSMAYGPGYGGGARECTLVNCLITKNVASGEGGGAANCALQNCAVTKNSALTYGGGVYDSKLVNCTITGNSAGDGVSYGDGAGAYYSSITNSIVLGNTSLVWGPPPAGSNYSDCTIAFSCTDPLSPGAGNISVDPLLLPDGAHLTALSPCLGAGTPIATGTDIDGQAWAGAPAIGCDEWYPDVLVAAHPVFKICTLPRTLSFSALAAGQPPFSYAWTKDGVLLQNSPHYSFCDTEHLKITDFEASDAGAYRVLISNGSGTVTSRVAQVVIHCAKAGATTPLNPYGTWDTAASNIQDAIDAAGQSEIVLVGEGIYSSGGKSFQGLETNRVMVDKALTVLSLHGASATIIEGAWDPVATNGSGAIRCAWLTNDTVLAGFTLRNGATWTGDYWQFPDGGGAWCSSTSAVILNCQITNNQAAHGGGGASGGTLNNCFLFANYAPTGGGAYFANLNNCTVVGNTCQSYGQGGGICGGIARNSIIWDNHYGNVPSNISNWTLGFDEPDLEYCLTWPVMFGISNMDLSPLLLDLPHISTLSPCRGAGNPAYATGLDLDGEPWWTPPSIGCDEVVESNIVGPLTVSILAPYTSTFVNDVLQFTAIFNGRASRIEWSFGDGPAITNANFKLVHAWTNPGIMPVTLTAFNADYPNGVASSILVEVIPINNPVLQTSGMSSNAFAFQFAAQPYLGYTVEFTTNLQQPSWQRLTYVLATNEQVLISDPAPTNSMRFYRAWTR